MTDETKLTPMQKVDELIERGKSKGGLTYKEVIDTLGNDALDVDQMEVVYDRFEDADINVVEEIAPVEIAGEDVTEIDPKLAVTEGIAIAWRTVTKRPNSSLRKRTSGLLSALQNVMSAEGCNSLT